VRVVVELQGRFRVRDRFHQAHVGVQHVLEHVLGVAGGSDAEHFELRALVLDLFADRLELIDRVLYRIAAGELV